MPTLPLSPDELLTTTRCVRRRLDLDRPVPMSLIRECLEIALQAPTGSNRQGWQWLVVDDAEIRRRIGDLFVEHGMITDQQLAAAGARPVGRVEPVGLRDRRRQARRQVGRGRHQSVASLPRIRLDTGVTIGPEITMDTYAAGTWLVDSPRICRAASMTSSRPCM